MSNGPKKRCQYCGASGNDSRHDIHCPTRLHSDGRMTDDGPTEQYRDLLIRFARHIRNTDVLPPTAWGVKGIDLLTELCDLIGPANYNREVKGKQ